ncbi:trans-aconitate 2-methyltransferase [Variovorax dokdonensis]|uniref:Trans-aconitate 2-methyltransferase n=1 Tax=Variovorax dokdonensis TaxID=344883 RepID=A0ABT7N6M9_9BURK|nr:trans-aconitate 2-methyltransferase [Variovorax dokdonensis]MDM0043599.1 trans-aconitate 2-methyltransferase [Variovorax dokdonensis]
MADWNPSLYSRYEDERTRPARDLLARVPLQSAALAFDLGCGPGNSTELLVERFPDADVVGTDNSPAMLDAARERVPKARFELSDIASWRPEVRPTLIYANAVLQWVPDHATLLPRLLDALAPGGVLAIQMPDNRDEPTHRLMREVAALPEFAQQIGDYTRLRTELLGLQGYYDLLAPMAEHFDIWRTTYQHPMASAASIVEWVRSTGLRPFIDPLSPPLRERFLAEYERRVADAYPVRADGQRLLAFPRLFIVATRSSAA